MSVIPISSAIIPNCRIGNFESACQLDGNSACFELKRASDADKVIVANATNKANVASKAYDANKADEFKADEADEAIVANEAIFSLLLLVGMSGCCLQGIEPCKCKGKGIN
jgi:hypothetical protein